MREDGRVRLIFSWPVIIAVCIIFWPLGLVLAVKRVSIDPGAMRYAALLLNIAGIIWSLFTILTYVVVVGTEEITMGEILLMMGIFYVPIAIFIFWVARRLKRRAERRALYIDMLKSGNVTKLEILSKSTGEPIKKVKKEVLGFIKNNIIEDAYIDENTQEVIFEDRTKKEHNTAEAIRNAKYDNVSKDEKKAVTKEHSERKVICQNCGATNVIYGNKGECEYCGSVLK